MLVTVIARNLRNRKFVLTIVIAILIFLFIKPFQLFTKRVKKVPLLEQVMKIWYIFSKPKTINQLIFWLQKVDKNYNNQNVWISMSYCYSRSVSEKQNRQATISAALSVRLYKELSGWDLCHAFWCCFWWKLKEYFLRL